MPQWPNLFVIGAAKAGTTSLHQILDGHPDIVMSKLKEPHYYASFRPGATTRHMTTVVRSRAKYLGLFPGMTRATFAGESSPSYLHDPHAAQRIATDSPDAKIIVLLRDPVERAYSHYLMDIREGLQNLDFASALKADAAHLDREWGGDAHLYQDLGRYAEQLSRYYSAFPRSQILVLETDELNSPNLRTRLANFLGLDAELFPDNQIPIQNAYARPRGPIARSSLRSRLVRHVARLTVPRRIRHSVRDGVLLVPDVKPTFPDELRVDLEAFFAEEIETVRELSRLPLPTLTSRWRRGRSSTPAGPPAKSPITDLTQIPLRRVSAFAALPILASITPFIVIPSITHRLGSAGWAALAIGQSVGAFATMIVRFGWAVTGPSEIAPLDRTERVSRYRTSVVCQALAALPTLPLAALFAYLVAPRAFAGASAMTAIAFGLWGFSPTWFFVGIGRPSLIAVFETIPRLAAASSCVVWLERAPSDLAYPICFGVAAIIAFGSAAVLVGGRPPWKGIAGVTEHFRLNALIMGSQIVASSFNTLSVPLLAIVGPAAVPAFAGVERFRALLWSASNSVASAVQGWIFEIHDSALRLHRKRIALMLTSLAGCIAGFALTVALPYADRWIFSNAVRIPVGLAVTTGLSVAVVAVAMSLIFHYLAPDGRGRSVLFSACLGAVAGLPLILILGHLWGAQGGATGVLVSEAASALWLVYRVQRPASGRRSRAVQPGTQRWPA